MVANVVCTLKIDDTKRNKILKENTTITGLFAENFKMHIKLSKQQQQQKKRHEQKVNMRNAKMEYNISRAPKFFALFLLALTLEAESMCIFL